MSVIEETKKLGAMSALNRVVDAKLYTAEKNCEEARKKDGMRYPNFAQSIAAARLCLDEAEAFHREMEAMIAAA